MRRSSAIAGVVALFLVGVVVGALAINLVNCHQLWCAPAVRHAGRGRAGAWPGGRLPGAHPGGRMADELHRRLNLNADQQRQLEAILADTHRETQAIWEEVRPRVIAVIERGQTRIAEILTPEQQQEFERYRRERAAHLRTLLGAGAAPAGAAPPR